MPHVSFGLGWPHLAVTILIFLTYLLLVFTNRLPTMQSVKDLADTVNTAGGHLILLALFSWYFFGVAMQFIYHVLAMPEEIITKQNAVVMMSIAFVTGTAFGGAWGALLKTMSGGKANGLLPPSEPVVK